MSLRSLFDHLVCPISEKSVGFFRLKVGRVRIGRSLCLKKDVAVDVRKRHPVVIAQRSSEGVHKKKDKCCLYGGKRHDRNGRRNDQKCGSLLAVRWPLRTR